VRVAGFGRTGATDADEGIRRQGTATVSMVTASELQLAPGPAQPCLYDSGGPTFVSSGGVELLAGVTSRGDGMCSQYAKEVRVDAHVDFIDGYLADTGPGTAALGARCLDDDQCTTGLCFTAHDSALVRYCSRDCAGDQDCGPLRCLQDGSGKRCQYPLPSPGAPGAACMTITDCLGSDCLDEPGQPHVCAPSCSPTQTDCPATFTCTRVGPIKFVCLSPSNGCAFAPHAPGPGALILLVVLCAGLRLRRRCR
jgi:hypothetical protein